MAIKSLKEMWLHPADTGIALRIPPITATTCDLNASRDIAAVVVTRRTNLGLYGPGPAHTHEGWSPSGSVSAVDSGGNFTVGGSGGTLSLTLACEFDNRNAKVPLLTSAGTPPTVAFYKRSDAYFAVEGIHEARYCLELVERLRWWFLAANACTLTVTVIWNTYDATNDNHQSDQTRSDEWTNEPTPHTRTFSVPVAAGEAYCFTNLVEGATYDRFERVVSIGIAFPAEAAGAWKIGEPFLWPGDPTQFTAKTHEGWQRTYTAGGDPVYEYHQGLISFHLDAAFDLRDSSDGNLGHGTLAEPGVRFFDVIIGAISGLDLTVAYPLADFCAIITNCQEVFDFTVDTAAVAAALTDDEDPANTLLTLRSFDVRDTSPGYTDGADGEKLEQDVSA